MPWAHLLQSDQAHFERHSIRHEAQHGFRKNCSCESQLILTTHDLAKGLDDKSQIDAVLLDFSKAFDKVAHHHLLQKLDHYGVRGQPSAWISAFLSGRLQRVVCEGSTSAPAAVISGGPQGTVLGSLLSLAYINDYDLPDCVSSTPRLFADQCLSSLPADKLNGRLRFFNRTWIISRIGKRNGWCPSIQINVKSSE